MLLEVETINGTQRETVYDIDNFPYAQYLHYKTLRGKNVTYIDAICTFDIECTTIDGEKEYKKNKKDYKYKSNPFGFMYQWQFCFDDMVIFGRTMEELKTFFERLQERNFLTHGKRLIIYVHNLAYEFQFIRDIIEVNSVFAREKRKPIKVVSKGLEFRCSYSLSNMSFAKYCENSKYCTHYKIVDKYDYSKIRTPFTPLTKEELQYCYNDVRGLAECIKSTLEMHGETLASVPLTSTGFVRRTYRKAMAQNPKNRKTFERLKVDSVQYDMLLKAFSGGVTHANRFYSGKIIDNVYSKDITSSYPTVIAECYYPMGKFAYTDIDTQDKLDEYCKKYCVVMTVILTNLKIKDNCAMPYISFSHCEKFSEDVICDNGRVMYADVIEITITEIDLEIIKSCYTFDIPKVKKAIYCTRGYLPSELVSTMMRYFEDKNKLKDVEGKEYEYMKSKNVLNSTYGMMVTKIVNDNIEYKEGKWEESKVDATEVIEKFFKSRNNFLLFQWGVYVTCHSRKRLYRMLNVVGLDAIYCDTDSIKYIGKYEKEFNAENERLKNIAEESPIKALCKTDVKTVYLGVWDDESKIPGKPCYKRFITLGAKKYAVEEYQKDGTIKFKITVSGMGKSKGAKAVGKIENFKVHSTFTDVGRTTSWYNDTGLQKININGDIFTIGSNIGILDTSYTLNVKADYANLIGLERYNFKKTC